MGRFDQVRANILRAYEAGRASVRPAGAADDDADDSVDFETSAAPADKAPVLTHPSTVSRDDADVPHGLRIAAAWAWRLLVLGVLGYYLLDLISHLRFVVVPLVVALLLSALLAPAVAWLRQTRCPRSLATALVVVGGLAAVVGTLTAVIRSFVGGVPKLSENVGAGIREIREWLRNGPLGLSDRQLDDAVVTGQTWLDQNTQSLTKGAVSTAATLFELLTGALLVLFALFFFLRDGRRIWRFLVRLLPAEARVQVHHAGEAAWGTLGAYVRATVLVAFIDALGIGLALMILNVSFAFPLAALVFLGAFVPIIGATLSGTVAVLVALVDTDGGPLKALLVLAAVVLVQQLEGHVLQPLIMGKAVAIHPLAVIVAIAAGLVLAGIVGALVAVPLVAVLNTAVRRIVLHQYDPPPDAVVVASHAP